MIKPEAENIRKPVYSDQIIKSNRLRPGVSPHVPRCSAPPPCCGPPTAQTPRACRRHRQCEPRQMKCRLKVKPANLGIQDPNLR